MGDSRVLHVASGREWRGGQRQVLLLARALAREGVAQCVVTGRDGELARRLTAEALPLEPVSWRMALDPRALPPLLRAVPPGEIVHAHDAHALALAWLAARLRGARLVATRRVDFPLRRPFLWRQADAVIAISAAVRSVLLRDGIPAGRIHVVPSAIDLEAPRPEPRALAAELGLPAATPVALFVGALVAHKGPDLLVDVAARLRARGSPLHWVLLGDGPCRAALATRIAAAGLTDRVHLAGWVDDPRPWLAGAALLLAPSREEGLNTSVLDALALGVPVVATAAGGLPEAVGDAGRLLPPGDIMGLADAVESLLQDGAERDRLRAAGRQQVAAFALPRMAAGVRSVYRSLR